MNFIGRLYPEFRFRRPPPSYSMSMQEYQAAISNMRRQGLIPQTPPPQYKFGRSMRTSRNSTQIIYPVNPAFPNTAPPRYTVSDQIEEIELVETDTSSISSNQLGIENPTFQFQEEEITDTFEMNTESSTVTVDARSNTSQSMQNETADNRPMPINIVTNFSHSIEVTHL